MSDSNTLNKALAKAQSEMASVGKNKTNPHFKSQYADLSAVIEACMPALNANGIAVVQTTEMREGGQMVMVTTLMHSSGESVASEMPLLIGKQDMQGLGSAITYARRYSLMGVTALAPDDDDGNAAAKSVAPHNAQPRPQSIGPDGEAMLGVSNQEMLQALKMEAGKQETSQALEEWWKSQKVAKRYHDMKAKWPQGATMLFQYVADAANAFKEADAGNAEMDNAAKVAA